MMERSDKIKIVYIYVNDWEYMYDEDYRNFEGHPKPGHVYRAIIDSDGIKIPLINNKNNPVHGILIDNFSGENNRWKYDIKEINENEIALLDINEDDLKKIKEWENINNNDIKIFYTSTDNKKDNKESKKIPVDVISDEDIDEMAKNAGDDIFIGTIFRTLMEYMYSNDPRFLLEIQMHILNEIEINLNEKLK